jgi:hypothetical protein
MKTIKTLWECWTYDVWGNAEVGEAYFDLTVVNPLGLQKPEHHANAGDDADYQRQGELSHGSHLSAGQPLKVWSRPACLRKSSCNSKTAKSLLLQRRRGGRFASSCFFFRPTHPAQQQPANYP